jgi:HrpA-like RNA helicase
MMHPVEVYYLEDLEGVMGRSSFIMSKLSKARISDDEEVDVDLVAAVISSIVDIFAKRDGAILCFLPVS